MIIKEARKGNKHIFYVGDDEAPLAEMVYSLPAPGKMIVEHTEVDDSLAGQGVGKQLVAHAVEYARINHLHLLPLCPFTKSVIEKTPAYQDVLL